MGCVGCGVARYISRRRERNDRHTFARLDSTSMAAISGEAVTNISITANNYIPN